jgi:hypothetical protein
MHHNSQGMTKNHPEYVVTGHPRMDGNKSVTMSSSGFQIFESYVIGLIGKCGHKQISLDPTGN